MTRCPCGRFISHHKHMCLACMWQEAQKRVMAKRLPKENYTCKWCGKEYVPNSSRQMYCSDECRKAVLREYENTLKTLTCMVCGKEFQAKRNSVASRCYDCRENHRTILSRQRDAKKKRLERKMMALSERKPAVEAIPEGPCDRDAWMGDCGWIPLVPQKKIKACLKINPAELKKPMFAPTRDCSSKYRDKFIGEEVGLVSGPEMDNGLA